MRSLLNTLQRVPEFKDLLLRIDAGRCPVATSGLSPVHRAFVAAGIARELDRPVVLLCPEEVEGAKLARDLEALLDTPVLQLPGREFTFHTAATVSHQWEHKRLAVFRAMAQGKAPVVVATVEGFLQRTLPPAALEQACFSLKMGESYDLNDLCDRLTAAGYARCEQVEGPGQFALRGGILDFFSPSAPQPVRVEFWGDELDSMGVFDPATQRRVENIDEAEILPAAETLPRLAPGGLLGLAGDIDRRKDQVRKANQRRKLDHFATLTQTLESDARTFAELGTFAAADRYLDLIYPDFACGADYLPAEAVLLFCDSPRAGEAAKNYRWRQQQDITGLLEAGLLWGEKANYSADYDTLCRHLGREFPVVYLDSFLVGQYPADPRATLSFGCKQLPSFGTSLEAAAADLSHYQKNGLASIVLCSTQGQAKVLSDMLREQGISTALDFDLKELPGPGETTLTVGGLSAGMEWGGIAILTEGSAPLSGAKAKKPRSRKQQKASNRQKLQSFTDLSPGDLVVHEQYGVGRFLEMTTMKMDGVEKDYIKIAYAGADTLYVPATQLDLISKYIGGGEDSQERTKLSKLGGTDWARAKARTRKATKELAKGLIQLYAQRQRQPGYAFHPDDPWQREFEDKFEYQETGDQLRCIAEIKADMERPVPMDRLLCGDVGYGKTEVALRAVMKCVLEGKQAAILVPTTVLANQHYQTALRRFEGYPVRIAVVSRFQTGKVLKQILADLAAGLIDVLIGTHRLLQKDVVFKDLGLLVVDEEQRFGVTHKERLKEISRQVDVLTLSATPIPRTLNMALSGIRDMSTIEEPPQDRLPVQTYVLEHDWSVLADAMRREVGRGGQVYYLHNRVETIEKTAAYIQGMLGDEVTVAVGHGKMSQEELARVMERVVEGEVQILVCTTIIETGIDISNVNTLIIEDADKMGLAQLHQLRGRVGRSSRRAYAYLTYRRGKVLSEVAEKRLSAIREYAEFGSGFKIAMRDLEIRGAGNILGPEQSGFLMSVGYDLYLKLLEEAVLEERGEKVQRTEEVSADLAVSANIPEKYVSSPEQRMDLYRRIARIRTEEDADDVVDELVDRYGDPPRAVNNLISIALLRSQAAQCGFGDISQKGLVLTFTLKEFDLKPIAALSGVARFKGRILFSPGEKSALSLRLKPGEDVLAMGHKLVETYQQLLAQ